MYVRGSINSTILARPRLAPFPFALPPELRNFWWMTWRAITGRPYRVQEDGGGGECDERHLQGGQLAAAQCRASLALRLGGGTCDLRTVLLRLEG